jgi:Mrp family chromosome partitioning ATPase/predicted Fe-Mo cluster-binding NifX family protein
MPDHGGAKAAVSSSPADRAGLLEQRKERIARRMGEIRHKMIVLSGKGGVGKSTAAACIALGLAARGFKVGLIDTDIHGPSIPKMLGLEGLRATAVDDTISPIIFSGNLSVMSIAFLLRSTSDAVIWRGPLKMGVIEEFLGNVDWGPLDYLIVDSPPGTGDEPLSVCQAIPDLDGAIIVATPQAIALADVERSITFCRKVNTPVIGLIENMSGFVCPKCGERVDIFKRGGAEYLAEQMAIPFLGRIPIVPEVVEACDSGSCSLANIKSDQFKEALEGIIGSVARVGESSLDGAIASSHAAVKPGGAAGSANPDLRGVAVARIALPLDGDRLSTHFGHSSRFAVYYVEGGKVTGERFLTPPPHAPGVIPSWLKEQGIGVVIAGGLGRKAIAAFEESGISVVCGAPSEPARDVVTAYLDGTLVTGGNVCDH